jgi:hypothetical protein
MADNFLGAVSQSLVKGQILRQMECPITYRIVCKEAIQCPGIRYLDNLFSELLNPLSRPVSGNLKEREEVGGLCVVATNESRCVTCSLLLGAPAGYTQR